MENKLSFDLTSLEWERLKTFKEKHLGCAKQDPTTIGGYYTIEITPTSIAPAFSLRCNVCGEKENITEYENW